MPFSMRSSPSGLTLAINYHAATSTHVGWGGGGRTAKQRGGSADEQVRFMRFIIIGQVKSGTGSGATHSRSEDPDPNFPPPPILSLTRALARSDT